MAGLLSRIGIGAAQVDTILHHRSASPGAELDATVHVKGGKETQHIGQIELYLVTQYHTDEGAKIGVLDKQTANEAFSIAPNEEKQFEVDIKVPYGAPLSLARSKVWVRTELAVDWALDPSDMDELRIVPGARAKSVLQAVESLGFEVRKAECKQVLHGFELGFAQELECKPVSGPYKGKVNEIEIALKPEADQLTVILEVDAQMKGIAGIMGGELEKKQHFQVTQPDAAAIAEQLRSHIG